MGEMTDDELATDDRVEASRLHPGEVMDDTAIEQEVERRTARALYILGLQQAHTLLRTAKNNVKMAIYAAAEDGVHASELRSIIGSIENRMWKIETEVRSLKKDAP